MLVQFHVVTGFLRPKKALPKGKSWDCKRLEAFEVFEDPYPHRLKPTAVSLVRNFFLDLSALEVQV
jgi:hypothetical protein